MFWHVQGWADRKQGKADSKEAKHGAVQADELSSINWLMPDGAGAGQVCPKDPQNLLNPVTTAQSCSTC